MHRLMLIRCVAVNRRYHVQRARHPARESECDPRGIPGTVNPNWICVDHTASTMQGNVTLEFLYPIPAAIITALIVGIFGWVLQRQLLRHQNRSRIRESIVGFISNYRRYDVFIRPADGMHFVDPQQFGTDLTNAVMWSIGLDAQTYLDYLQSRNEVDFRKVLENIAELGQVPLGNRYSFFPWSCRLQDDPQPGMVVPYIHSPGQFPDSPFHVDDCPDSPYYQFRHQSDHE